VTSGESLAQLADRVGSWLSDVAREHSGGLVVGVTHLEPLRAILLRLLDRPLTDLFAVNIGLGHAVRLSPSAGAEALNPQALRGVLTGDRADFG
jgi:broad specificity phosphatase PhoE